MNTEKNGKKTPTPPISHILKSKGWTCTRLAKAMDVSQPTASTWLRGTCLPMRKRLPKLSQVTSTQLSRLQAAHAEAARTRKRTHKNGNKKVHTTDNIVLENLKRNDCIKPSAVEAIAIEMPMSFEQLMNGDTPELDTHMLILKLSCALSELSRVDQVRCFSLANEIRQATLIKEDSDNG